MQRKLNWKVLGLAGATVVVAGLSLARPAQSADHKDAPKTTMEQAADINDVYSWVEGNNLVMAMTVFPFAEATAKFSDKVQYVFHTTSGAAFGPGTGSANVICTFTTAQIASCWIGAAADGDYVTGNASAAAGITSASGKTKVYAGRINDPFFFNLTGFKDATVKVEAYPAAALAFNSQGCPTGVTQAISATLTDTLKETASTANPARAVTDDFATAQGLVIVVQVDRALLTKGGPTVSVWASTNRGQ